MEIFINISDSNLRSQRHAASILFVTKKILDLFQKLKINCNSKKIKQKKLEAKSFSRIETPPRNPEKYLFPKRYQMSTFISVYNYYPA